MSAKQVIRRFVLILALSACSLPALAQVVARVNGAPITNDQLDRAYEGLLRERKLHVTRMQNPAQARDFKRSALDRLIQEELFWQEARKEGLAPSDREIDAAVERAVAQAGSRDKFQLQLIRQGIDEAAYRDRARRLIAADRYADRVVTQRVKVESADIEAFYKANPQLFGMPERWHVRTLMLAAPAAASVEDRRRARVRIESLRKQLAAGADFATLARQYSEDPTRQWGGALDPAPLADLPDWMRAPVAKLKPGELSPVIETAQGYHLLKLEARLPATRVPLAEAQTDIGEHLQKTRGAEALDQATAELRAAAKIEILVPL